ncbi:uncharacterized protein FSUBG_13490 [Fusarium subglutinans]|uniref:Uncharacterized protein n=1 Tax=Gibberella subglutinans TaxID=42677 RepID=A0A8H5KX10_GIBSU|nr:uncharacterized protein FSUBG_13490 [Fusarium subglutinans]KAF5580051.1 hypothetical protein FSUBG_13490 [Fusarium subglutinans]
MSDLRDLATETGSNLTATGDSEHSVPRPGPPSRQPNSPAQGTRNGGLMIATLRNSLKLLTTENSTGQLDGGIMNLNTDELARSGIQVTMTTPLGAYRITLKGGDITKLSKVMEVAYSVNGPGQSFSAVIDVNNLKSALYRYSKRKRLPLDYDELAEREARAPTRRHSCLKADDDGLMKGCPRCDTLSHNASNCSTVKTDKERFVWFVKKRGSMPSFLDFNTWFRLASVEGSLTAQDRFPWSAKFTKFNADDIEQLQNDLDTLGLGEDQKALDASQETVVLDGVVMNKKRAAIILAGDS